MFYDSWEKFNEGLWENNINVREFIQDNYTPYYGDHTFLKDPTKKTKDLWEQCETLIEEEIKKGILGVDLDNISAINAFNAGYIDKENETIVGLQTDKPLKRIINPFGGIRMVKQALEAYDYKLKPEIKDIFTKYRKTHNDGVFDAYTEEMRKARSAGLLTGLPDAYGRGRIIGDYRRIPLYGVDYLIKNKEEDLKVVKGEMNETTIRKREEISEQIRALIAMKEMALKYGIDISKPAKNAEEAVQFLYFGYLAGVKENNGAAMSLGRVSSFIDIYIERDLNQGILTEEKAQEIIDQFVIKLRLVRHLRTPEYNDLFAGDPNWITEAIGGMGLNGETLVTKTSYRFLNTLNNLGPAPEPNMTVLWSQNLPENFKKFCADMSIKTDSIQYENDDLMRDIYGDDYGIACCVSAMTLGSFIVFYKWWSR